MLTCTPSWCFDKPKIHSKQVWMVHQNTWSKMLIRMSPVHIDMNRLSPKGHCWFNLVLKKNPRKVRLWYTLLEEHFGGGIWAPSSTISLVTTQCYPTPHMFLGGGVFHNHLCIFYKIFEFNLNYYLNLLWQMFYGNFKNLFSKQTNIFQPPCTNSDWLGNIWWL